jgi:hypothetical protein
MFVFITAASAFRMASESLSYSAFAIKFANLPPAIVIVASPKTGFLPHPVNHGAKSAKLALPAAAR